MLPDPTFSDSELQEIYDFAVQLGKDAGEMLMDAAKSRLGDLGNAGQSFVEKDSAVDIVTKTDEGQFDLLLQCILLTEAGFWRRHTANVMLVILADVEAFIRTSIAKKYPSHKFLGEETYSAGSSREYLVDASSPTWVVDPLDGTVNFTHLFPMFCVSIGFVLAGRPVVGVIYAPFMNQLFSACKEKGAWLNESLKLPLVRNPVPPIPANAPKGCIFSCEWGKDRRDIDGGNLHRKVASFVNMAAEVGGRDGKGGMVHGIRSLGSATLDLAYTAAGSFDIWWEGGCWEWDVAAGIAILVEAGGLVTNANPPPDPETAEIKEAKLGGRLYLAIRPAGPSAGETGRQGQERLVREVWKCVEGLDYSRPGA